MNLKIRIAQIKARLQEVYAARDVNIDHPYSRQVKDAAEKHLADNASSDLWYLLNKVEQMEFLLKDIKKLNVLAGSLYVIAWKVEDDYRTRTGEVSDQIKTLSQFTGMFQKQMGNFERRINEVLELEDDE